MIFITVGTTRFPFARMKQVFQKVCRARQSNELVIFQHGTTPVITSAKNVALQAFMDFKTMDRYLRQARIVICHGGPGTIYQALGHGKTPLVLPRERNFGEHVDNHQTWFVDFMEKQKIIYRIYANDEISLSLPKKQPEIILGKTRGRLITYLSSLT